MSLIADVFDFQILTDKDELFASTTLESADVNVAVDEQEVIAGKGAAIIANLHSARRIDISVAEMEFKWDFIQNQLGRTATTGKVNAMALPKYYTSATNETAVEFTLDEEPIATDSKLIIVDIETGTKLVKTTGYTIAGKVVTIVGGAAGKKYYVPGYYYETVATASSVELTTNDFPAGAKCILTTLEITNDEKPLNIVQVQLDEVLPSGNFTLATTTQRNAVATNFTFKAVKSETSNNSLGRIHRIPIASA